MKYKSDSKKYCKSEVQKYKNISNKTKQSERADLVDMCPDFDFFMFVFMQMNWTTGEATAV